MAEDKATFLNGLFEQIESQVQFGDNKASLLVAGNAILLAISGGLIKMVSGCPKDEFTVSCLVPSATLGLAAITSVLLIASLTCALLAARPAKIHDKPPRDFFLLSHIACIDRDAFVKEYDDASYNDLLKQALISIHAKAAYATEKFRWLKRAVNTTLVSLGFTVATVLAAILARVVTWPHLPTA